MSCEKCNEEQESAAGSYFFRWKNANIEVRGCQEHITEVFSVLRDVSIRDVMLEALDAIRKKSYEPDPERPALSTRAEIQLLAEAALAKVRP